MKAAQQAAEIIRNYDGKKLRIMEVCGTHTHEIFRQGIRKMLPENIQLISGPGCPVCVTPVSYIDEAVYLALEKGCLITTFGDLVRVPGTEKSLASARAEGAEIRPVYSPLDALQYTEEHPEKQVVFLSVGFETTTPPSLMAVRKAKEEGLKNFSILTANKTMDNAYLALKDSADAFLYPGHVSTISGTKIYYDLMKQGISGVVTGFTGPELLTALAVIVTKSQAGQPFFMHCYPRVVTDEGSPAARKLAAEMTDAVDSEWRGIGIIPKSGLQLKPEYADYDARLKYDMPKIEGHANPACRCGSVLKGEITPEQCPVFGKGCTPEHPVGACMVSGEGACAAFYKYGRDF